MEEGKGRLNSARLFLFPPNESLHRIARIPRLPPGELFVRLQLIPLSPSLLESDIFISTL